MQLKKFFSPEYFYHLILFCGFSISMNNLLEIPLINIFFYVFIHILIIYLAFYYFNFILYFVYLFYGIFIDYFLLNQIGPHLIVFISLLFFIAQFKKYMFNLSSKKIFIITIVIMYLLFLFEMILAQIIANYNFEFIKFIQLCLIGTLILYPFILICSKIEKI